MSYGSKLKKTLQIKTISSEEGTTHTLTLPPEDGTSSSSSLISMETLSDRDSAEYYFTPINVTPFKNSGIETFTSHGNSAESPISDEETGKEIVLPRYSAENLICGEKSEDEIVLLRYSLKNLLSEEESEDEIVLPGYSVENLISEEETDDEIILPRISVKNTSKKRIEHTETPKTDIEPQNSTCKQDSMIFFNIVEKLARLLKSRSGGRLISIFEKIVFLTENPDADKIDTIYDIMDIFIENIEDCNVDYLRYLKALLVDTSLPKELRRLYVAKNKIEDHYIVGKGSFGEVRRGKLKKPGAPFVTVAIKKVHRECHNSMFLEEASIMARLDHEVVLKLMAFTYHGRTVKLIVEYMEYGDLVDVIVKERLHLSPSDVLTVIHDVASGMEYLSDMQYVHRDLKCGNIFIGDRKECKIGDFGLCKYVGDSDGVYEEKELRLYFIHVAPETKDTSRFTTKSDVWAMGVVIWELYNLLKLYSNDHILRGLYTVEQMWEMFLACGCLQIPGCPKKLHNYLVEEILSKNPVNRPSFGAIKKKIIDIIKMHYNYVSFG